MLVDVNVDNDYDDFFFVKSLDLLYDTDDTNGRKLTTRIKIEIEKKNQNQKTFHTHHKNKPIISPFIRSSKKNIFSLKQNIYRS